MKCRQAGEKISAYVDHELDAASTRQLESHLRRCAQCRQTLDDFQGIDEMVRGLPRIELGSDFAGQMVMQASGLATAGQAGCTDGSSLLERLFRFAQDFVDLVSSARSSSTGILDEFSDFPPLSMGHVYFKLMDTPARARG